jgi:hypothetical protein
VTARVSPAWLDAREAADAAARSEELAERLARRLPSGGLTLHDLGGGTGAMGRWLAPRLPGPQRWVVHDRDPDLLAVARAHGAETRRSDIARLAPRDLDGADAVVASALLDLLTEGELRTMLRACAGRPMLLALTVVGRVRMVPEDPLDARFEAAFNAHQRRGGRLGPHAVVAAAGALRDADCVMRPTPWRLGPADADLVAEWLDGWLAAACEREPALAAGDYPGRRLAQAAAGELAVTVDHADLLVLP